jgi:hypothetical protein
MTSAADFWYVLMCIPFGLDKLPRPVSLRFLIVNLLRAIRSNEATCVVSWFRAHEHHLAAVEALGGRSGDLLQFHAA